MHELFEILNCDPHWQTRYRTLRDAAEAMNCLPEYHAYRKSLTGLILRAVVEDAPDVCAQNEHARRMRARMSNLAMRANPHQQYTIEGEYDYVE